MLSSSCSCAAMPSRRIIPQPQNAYLQFLYYTVAVQWLFLLEYQSLLTIIFWQLKKEMVGLAVTMTKV